MATTSVFLSYSRKDEAAVRRLEADLERGRVTVWWDSELRGGDPWWQKILEQIRLCDVFVLALSNNGLASKPCRAELAYARDLGLPVLPVQIGPVDSLRTAAVGELQVIDYREQSSASGMALFAELAELARRRGPLPDPLPSAPVVPFAYLLRLGSEIEKEALTPVEQADLVNQLRDCLETEDDEGVKEDARELLRALRRRQDVTYKYAGEIDQLLAGSTARGSDDQSVPPPRQDTESQRAEEPAAAGTGSGSTRQAPGPHTPYGPPPPGYGPPGYGMPPPDRPAYPPGGAGFAPPPGPVGPPQKKSRAPLLLGLGAVAITGAAVGGVLLFGQDRGADPGPGPTTAVAGPSTSGSGTAVDSGPAVQPEAGSTAEADLLAILPLDFDMASCSSAPLAGDGDVASVSCGQSFTQPGPGTSEFGLYPAGAVDAAFLTHVTGFGVQAEGTGEACPDFQGYDFYTNSGAVKGRVACWVGNDNGAYLLWTEDEDGAEALVTIPDGGVDGLPVLWSWWQDPANSGFGG